MFSGDLVVAGSSVTIDTRHGGDLQQYLDSLERMRALKPRRLLPAHGAAIGDPAAIIGEYLAHRRHREEQVLEALGRGDRTVESIAESIYHGLDPALVPAARENVRAHLIKLEQEGRAFEEESSHTWTT
jgi:hydroxyacylglutathione hydrolase